MSMAKGQYLGRSFGFIAWTERAESALENYCVPDEITWSACAIGRDNDPTSCDRVLPKFGQLGSFPKKRKLIL